MYGIESFCEAVVMFVLVVCKTAASAVIVNYSYEVTGMVLNVFWLILPCSCVSERSSVCKAADFAVSSIFACLVTVGCVP